MKKKNNSVIFTLVRIAKIGSVAFVVSVLGGILSGLASYLISYLTGKVSSEAIQQIALGQFDLKQLGFLFIGFLLVLPVLFTGQMLNLSGGLKSENRLKYQVLEKALSQDEAVIKANHTGDLMARLTSDAATIEDFYFQGLNYRVINPLVSGLAALITIFTINAYLGFISILFGLLSAFISKFFSPKILKSAELARRWTSAATKVLSEILGNEEYIRLANIQETLIMRYQQENQRQADATVNTEKYAQHAVSLNEALGLATQVCYLMICTYLSLNAGFSFSNVMLLIALQPNVSTAFGNLGASWNYFVEVSVSGVRVLEVLDTPQEDERKDKPALIIEQVDNPIVEFKDVSFGYQKNHLLFDKLNLSIYEHETIALVGASGSGKTSLFQLLLGFYQPQKGEIKVSQKSLQDYSLASIRQNMIYIQQESPLFNRSIKENIAMGARVNVEEISMDRIIEAAKAASIHDFIMSLDQGYETLVGESASQISGGQRQRIAIARAFMSDAPILIMDEPTSALDAESEALIQQSLQKMKHYKTILVSAHRLSTIRDADRIVVMEHGKVVEIGTHGELFSKKGYYYNYTMLQTTSFER